MSRVLKYMPYIKNICGLTQYNIFCIGLGTISDTRDNIDFDTGHYNDWSYFVVGVYIIEI